MSVIGWITDVTAGKGRWGERRLITCTLFKTNQLGKSRGNRAKIVAVQKKDKIVIGVFCMGVVHKRGNYGKFACDWPQIR